MGYQDILLTRFLHLQRKLPASHQGQGRLSVSLVLSKTSELCEDDVQLAALSHHRHEKVDNTQKKQLMECSDCKNFDIRCDFLLLITWDVALLVVVVSYVDFIDLTSCRRFSVLWPMLLIHPQPPDTIQECPQGDLQVW